MSNNNANVYPGVFQIRKSKILVTEDQVNVEIRAVELVENNHWGLCEDYRVMHQNWINTDFARDLFPEYSESNQSRALYSSAVQGSAAVITNILWESILSNGEIDVIIFTAGGSGVGKSSAVGKIVENYSDVAVYDSSMAMRDKAQERIEAALGADKEVIIIYVHRPFDDAFRSIIDRAVTEGRTVPIKPLAYEHYHTPNSIRKLVAIFQDNPSVTFRFLDNSHEPGEATEITLQELPPNRYNTQVEIEERAQQILDEEYARRKGKSNEIPEYVYKGIASKNPPTK